MLRTTDQFRRLLVGLLLAVLGMAMIFSASALGQEQSAGTVNQPANLRAGPGTGYAIVGQLAAGDRITIQGATAAGDWYRLTDGGWIAAFLVDNVILPAPLTATAAVRNRRLVLPSPTPTPRRRTQSLLPTVTPTPQPTRQVAVLPTPQPLLFTLPAAAANRAANLRGGPGTAYPIVGAVATGEALTVTGSTADQSWYQLAGGEWIAAFLVTQATTVDAQATTPASPAPAAPTPAPTVAGNDFVLLEKHLWDPYENGGSLDGESVHCGQARTLVVNVLDANGSRLNGVAVQVQYGAREIYVTGSQGKGDGVAEFVLGSGQDVKVIRDNDGRAVSSDIATGLATYPTGIETRYLIESNYCQDEASCKRFAEGNGCEGHFSWTVAFQRR